MAAREWQDSAAPGLLGKSYFIPYQSLRISGELPLFSSEMNEATEVGRVAKNGRQDIVVYVNHYQGREYVCLESVSAETGEAEDPARPKVLALAPAVVLELLPLLSQAQALAAKIKGKDG